MLADRPQSAQGIDVQAPGHKFGHCSIQLR
jgi:hypothetical protein